MGDTRDGNWGHHPSIYSWKNWWPFFAHDCHLLLILLGCHPWRVSPGWSTHPLVTPLHQTGDIAVILHAKYNCNNYFLWLTCMDPLVSSWCIHQTQNSFASHLFSWNYWKYPHNRLLPFCWKCKRLIIMCWSDLKSSSPVTLATSYILIMPQTCPNLTSQLYEYELSLIHIWRCRRIERCRSRWSPYH